MSSDLDIADKTPQPSLSALVDYSIRIMRLAWGAAPATMSVLICLTFCAALLPAAIVYTGKLVIDGVIGAIQSQTSADRNSAIAYVVIEAALLAGLLAVRRLLTFYKRDLHAKLSHKVSKTIFAKTLRLELRELEKADVQQQILLARQHASARPYSLMVRFLDGAQHLITLVTFSLVLASFSPWAILLLIAGGIPLFLNELGFSGAVFRLATGRTPQMRQRNYLEGLMMSDSSGVERIHSQANDAISARYQALHDAIFKEDQALHQRHAWIGIAFIALSSAVFIAGKVWIVLGAIGGTITIGAMTMYIAALKQGQNTLTAFLTSLNGGYGDLLYASNLYALLELDEGAPRGSLLEGAAPATGYRFENVSFTYPGNDRPALTNISINVPPGSRLGIAGINGSGKSTLIKLLTGLYLPDEGEVLLDGTPTRDWLPEALFERSAALFQPFQRYRFSVADNISMGDGMRTKDREALLAAAQAGLASPVLEDLPEGLDTKLSRQFVDGRELSGGQWQRLAIARAMLRTQADTLILDEPTSALDPVAEAAFIDEISKGQQTVILISHRLSNLRNCDQIAVLKKGHIVELGTHDDLLAKGREYRKLFDKQADFYRRKAAN